MTAMSLRRQILLSFIGFAVVVSLLSALCSFVIAYVVEDSMFEDRIAEEVERQRSEWLRTGSFAPPGADFISIHSAAESFPRELRRQFRPDQRRGEYAGGEGRHYHVTRFALDGGGSAFAVAEVGNRLAVRTLQGELLAMLALGAAAVLLAAAGLGYWLARRATAPLGRLVKAASDVPSGEVPRIRSADFPRNEVGTLAATLEAMLERIRAFVEREVSFTRDASHELRTPLSVIRSSVELIESKGPVAAPIERPLRRIGEAALQMEQAIAMLLLLAREERAQSAGAAAFLLPLVERVVLAESARWGGEGFRIDVAVPEDARLAIDESVAAAILGNLVGNAFRHTEAGPLRIAAEGERVVVSDQGGGIPAGILATLGEGSRARARGAGFGLSIVARLCRVHGIRFELESGEGGTAASVALIRCGEAPPPA